MEPTVSSVQWIVMLTAYGRTHGLDDQQARKIARDTMGELGTRRMDEFDDPASFLMDRYLWLAANQPQSSV